jgi:hypothetical protein
VQKEFKEGSSSFAAIERIHKIRTSVASARPYAAALLGYGEIFTYSEGLLCYADGPVIRVLNLHSSSEYETVIDVFALSQRLAASSGSSNACYAEDLEIKSLSFSEGVLVCVCRTPEMDESWLFVIDLGTELPKYDPCGKPKRRLPVRHKLSCTTKLFIRHNRSYLYYGTHSALRSDNHHEWLVNGLNLETGLPVSSKPFRLADFVGSDSGSTACFKIHEGHLYIVSNQTSFEVEEVDWTSYYHCIKIPLGEASPDLKPRLLWQRQHNEGPINDSWTDLSLQKDEQTNDLLIVECRKEWLGGGSANIRTYYTQPLRFDSTDDIIQTSNFPQNDPLTKTLDENSRPHYSDPRKRIRKHYHHEYDAEHLNPLRTTTPPRDFILAMTKFRAYNVPAMSFIDLVSDPAPLAPGSVRMRDHLRLRIASRKKKSPLIPDPQNPESTILRKPELDENDLEIEGSEEDFTSTDVHLWPPDDAPIEIYDVLCPSGRSGSVDAVADEKSIVYTTDSGMSGTKALVMISFDPMWGFKGMGNLNFAAAADARAEPRRMKLELPKSFAARPASKRASPASEAASGAARAENKRQKSFGGQSGAEASRKQRVMWREEAMYRAIKRGYRFSYGKGI